MFNEAFEPRLMRRVTSSADRTKSKRALTFQVAAAAAIIVSSSGADPAAASERATTNDRDIWSGYYAGLIGSSSRYVTKGTTLASDGTVSANATREQAFVNDRSFGAGLVLGTRALLNSGLVFGLETDFSHLWHRDRNVNTVSSGTWAGQRAATIDYKTDWLGTARLNIGMPVGNVLFFGTGGAAVASERQKRTQYVGNSSTGLVEFAFAESDRQIRKGVALGGGVEWRFATDWSMRAEYLHVRFLDETFRFPDARGGVVPWGGYLSVQGRLADNGAHMNIVRVGVAYRFGTKE